MEVNVGMKETHRKRERENDVCEREREREVEQVVKCDDHRNLNFFFFLVNVKNVNKVN